jgi:hypothetical protein
MLTQSNSAISPSRGPVKKRELPVYIVKNDHSAANQRNSINDGLDLELKIQNSVLSNLIRTLVDIFQKSAPPSIPQEIDNSNFYLALLPEHVAQKFDTTETSAPKSHYARVELLSQRNQQGAFRVRFLDYGYEVELNQSAIYQVNKYLMKLFKLLPSSLNNKHRLQLDFDLNSIPSECKEHLNEIFALLVKYEKLDDLMCSQQFKCVFDEKRHVRLYDPARENLDLNRVIEYSMLAMCKSPITGTVIQLTEGLTQFDFLNEHAKRHPGACELTKIYNATGLFRDEDNFLTSESSLAKGQLCMVNVSTHVERIDIATSILNNDDHVIDDVSMTTEFVKKDLNRAVIVHHSDNKEKIVVLNVDSGKQLTVNRNRVCSIPNTNRYCRLARILPFMTIKAKLAAENDKNSEKAVHDSKLFGNKIQLSIAGSWQIDSSIHAQPAERFIQTEKDLCKLVKLLNLGIH